MCHAHPYFYSQIWAKKCEVYTAKCSHSLAVYLDFRPCLPPQSPGTRCFSALFPLLLCLLKSRLPSEQSHVSPCPCRVGISSWAALNPLSSVMSSPVPLAFSAYVLPSTFPRESPKGQVRVSSLKWILHSHVRQCGFFCISPHLSCTKAIVSHIAVKLGHFREAEACNVRVRTPRSMYSLKSPV